jgi:hypothetical protein
MKTRRIMARRPRLDRRTMLRGLIGGAAVAVGLPLLDIFLDESGTALAGGDALPKRFGIFFWGNGVLPVRWVPASTGAAWELSETLAPLAAVKDQINVVSGMKVYTGNMVPHFSGPVGMFSGAPYPLNDMSTFAEPSIDQVIANAVGKDTRFKSLEVAVEPGGISLSYNGPHSVNPPESSPIALFNRVFVNGFVMPGTTPIPDPRLPLRRSVLDAIQDDVTGLQAQLGSVDKTRLEEHLEGIRELEQRLVKLEQNPPSLANCALPPKPLDVYPDIEGRPALSDISRAMVDILVMALACDQTRVFSDWFSSPVDNLLYPSASKGHHQLTHDEPDPQDQVADILLYIMTELAYLLSALRAVPEGIGTLLDHCAILATSDCSLGRSHSVEDYPIIIAGSCNGALKTGLHYRSVANENTSKVLLTLARAMGMTLDSYGKEAGLVSTSLSAIEV